MVISAPYDIDQVPDIIIYLSESIKLTEAVSYIRINPKDVLFKDEESYGEIKKWTLVEDLSRNKLNDEEFPGTLNMRVTFFEEEPPIPREFDNMPTRDDLKDLYESYVLRVHLFMARDLPPADDNGLSDPFMILKCSGEMKESSVKYQTLNPGWFEIVEMHVQLPRIGTDYMPVSSVSMLCYDRDSYNSKDLLGRALMKINGPPKTVIEGGHSVHYESYKEPDWYKLYFDALKEQKGFVLAGYGLMSKAEAERCPIVSIVPKTVPCNLSIICIGIRDLIDSMNFIALKRISCKFDVSGDSHEGMDTNKHLVKYNSVNLSEIITVPIDVPINPLFSPVLSVYVYDHVLGIVGTRLIGICHIPLNRYVKIALRMMLQYKREGQIGNVFTKFEYKSK